jgi:hypothetical protein
MTAARHPRSRSKSLRRFGGATFCEAGRGLEREDIRASRNFVSQIATAI